MDEVSSSVGKLSASLVISNKCLYLSCLLLPIGFLTMFPAICGTTVAVKGVHVPSTSFTCIFVVLVYTAVGLLDPNIKYNSFLFPIGRLRFLANVYVTYLR